MRAKHVLYHLSCTLPPVVSSFKCLRYKKKGLKSVISFFLLRGQYLEAFRMVQRLTYHHRLSYNTASNKTRLFRTPGNRMVYVYTKKVGKAPKSAGGLCPGQLQGVCAVRPKVLTRLFKRNKHGSWAHGGSTCTECVHSRFKRASLQRSRKGCEGVGSTSTESES
ncbi:large ribosomal subunit protein eL34-like [Vicugna pacos]|uniref:Large ribosomal subunit protein eL34 n=1 Tax=Vicugna pacos TaxID=30538 RepID=A0ABM5CTA5_VICPA